MSEPVLHVDVETKSAVDLKRTGAYVYFADPTTDLLCLCWAIDDDPVKTWLPGDSCPPELAEHIMLGGLMMAWNAAFERVCFEYILGPRYGWPVPEIEQWRCAMVMSYAMSLPGSLDAAAPAIGLDVRKDDAGHRLMLQVSRPRTKAPLSWWTDTHQDKLDRLIAYCVQDVIVEREMAKRLRPLKPSELALWHLDQRINSRGVYVDEELCHAAKGIVARVADAYDDEMQTLTSFEVTACSNVGEIVRYVKRRGVDTDSIAKDVVEEILGRRDLEGDIYKDDKLVVTGPVRRVLQLRQGAAKASVDKINALLRGMSFDGGARGLLQFHAASTGRWAGRRFQPQNLKRPDLDHDEVIAAIRLLRTGDYEVFCQIFDNPLSVIGDCIRGMIKARPGTRLIAADYSNIEGRVLAWLAGEHWKLQAFRDYDAGLGEDLYKITAAGILGKPVALITKSERQAYGKVPELACGYQGGVGAFQSMAVVYGVDVTDEEAAEIRDGYRETNPAIKQYWYDLENAAISAVEHPGERFNAGRVVFKKVGSFLFARLPSGRMLTYAYPRMVEKAMPWVDANGKHPKKWVVGYMGVNSYTRKWELCYAYGGLFAENVTSGTARDVLADAMPKIEAAGYPIVLTVHDEAVVEPPIGHGSKEEVFAIMGTNPEWAEGLPIAVAGFEAERYGK